MPNRAIEPRSAATIAEILERLYDETFGGKKNGRYRISRKFLLGIARRRRLTDQHVDEIAEELFETNFILVNVETYFVVLNQKLFSNYRRATTAAIARTIETVNGSSVAHGIHGQDQHADDEDGEDDET